MTFAPELAMTVFAPRSISRVAAGRTMLLAGTALGVSLLVQPAPARAADECGTPVNGVVTCPAGEQTGGVAYTGVTDLTLSIPATAPVSNSGAPAVQVSGSTGAVVVDAANVTGAGTGGQGILITTTSGSIVIDTDKAVTTGASFSPTTADAVVALSTSGDITITAGEVSTAGPYSSGVAAQSDTGDIVITVDKATSTGVGGGIVSGQSALFSGGQAIDGGTVTMTLGEVVAGAAAAAVQGLGYGDVSITADSITSNGGPAQGGAGFTSFGIGLYGRSYAGDVVAAVDTLTSTGHGNLGVQLRADAGDASLESGTVSASGNNAYGVRVTATGAASVTAGTTSTSGNAGADGAGTYFADAIIIEGGESMTVVADQTSASGNGAGAIVAAGNGSISIDSNSALATGDAVTLNGVQRFANAISAQSFGGDIEIVSGVARTEGNQSWAIYASAANGAVTIDSETATASGLGGRAIYANGGGGVTIRSGLASTTGGPSAANPSDAIFALTFGQPSDISITSETATTAGNGARGIYAWTNAGDIAIDSGAIVTGGAQATGIMVDANGAIPFGSYRPASGGAGQLSIVSDSITTSGNNSWGIGVDHAGPISIVSGSIITAGVTSFGITVYGSNAISIDSGSVHSGGAGIIAWGDAGPVTIDSDDVIVGPGGDIGIFARTSTGDIVINAGRTETRLLGLLDGIYTGDAVGASSQSGDITITSEEAVVVGEEAFGIFAFTGTGAVSISSGSITTSGVRGLGIRAVGGTVDIVSDAITTSGDLAGGIDADGDNGVSIASDSIVIGGANAIGIRALSGAGAVLVTSGNVSALGGGSLGIDIAAAGDAVLTVDGEVAGAAGGARINATGIQVIVDTGASISSQSGVGLDLAAGASGASVVTAGHITGGAGAAAIVFTGSSDDTLVLQSGATFGGAVLAGDGGDRLVLLGANQTGAEAFGDMFGFEQTTVEGAWTLTGLLQTDQIDIGAGGVLTIDGTDGALGEVETSGGDLDIVNDGRLVYASDDDSLYAPKHDVNIGGAGEVELISGAIVATGDWTFTGPTRVSGGELHVQTDIAGGLVQTGGVVVVAAALGVDDAGLGTLKVTGTGVNGSFGGDIVVEGGQLYLAWDGDWAVQNDIAGSGGEIIWAGAGSVRLDGVYDRSGLITNDSVGTVFFTQLGEASALNLHGRGFILDTGDHVTGGLSGDGDLLLGNGGIDGHLTVDMIGDQTFSGELSGGGGLTKSGDGILRLSGVNTQTGLTSVLEGALVLTGSLASDVFVAADGTFRLGRGGTEGDLTGDLDVEGLAIFDRSDEYDYTGDITGDGQLLKLGDARLILSGAYNFTGTTIVRGGSVRILHLPDTAVVSVDNGTLDLSGLTQTVSNLSGGEDGEINIEGGALTVDQAGSTTFAGAITGSGSFTLTGGGVIELSGTNTYTGDTNVEDGLLRINGSVASDVNIGPNGVLGGAGDIGGDVVVGSGGIVGPGNSPGTLTVAGDFTFASGSTYQVEVLGDGQHDLIVVGGATTIESGVQVEVLAGGLISDYGRLNQYDILTSAGGITGRFAGVTSDMAFLTPYLVYSANAVRLDLIRNDIRFNRFAVTQNQIQVADAAEASGYGSDVFDAVVVQNAAGAAVAYDALDGQVHADVFTSLAGGSDWLRGALAARQRESDAVGGWGTVLSGRQTLEPRSGVADAETETSGLVAGGDVLAGDVRLGAALSYSRDDLSVSDRGSTAEIGNVRLAAYAGKAFGPVRVTLGGVYGWSTVETTRDVVFPGFAERVTGEYDARTAEVTAEISTRFQMNKATIEPFARASYLNVETDDAAEEGGSAALVVAGQSRDLSTLEVGVRLSGELALSGATLLPRAGLAWRSNGGDLYGVTAAAFQGAPNDFAVRGAGLDKGALAVSFGADLVSTDRLRFSLDVEGVYGDRSESQSVRAGGSWRF